MRHASLHTPIPTRANRAFTELTRRLSPCPDLQSQSVTLSGEMAVVAWLDGLADKERLQLGIAVVTAPWMQSGRRMHRNQTSVTGRTPAVAVTAVDDMEAAVRALLEGSAVMFADGHRQAYVWDVAKPPNRAVERAQNEPSLQGPQEAFIESLAENLALVRKRLHTSGLKIETREIGVRAPVRVAVLYVAELAKPDLVAEVHRRVERIQTDTVIDLNVIREYITDTPFTLFPLTEETERPERVVSSLLQGRVAILVDGAPNCILLPVTFLMFLSSPEDYYMHYALSLPLRILRHLMFWMTVLLPALYVALLTYDQDLIPTPLLVSVVAQHAGIPFPTMVEALGMMISFEALREAGTRLPRAVGQSVSIVGTLIIGDAAVRAGLVSPGMVIIVAATGVASFTLPSIGLVQATRLLQFPFVISAALFGLYGLVLLGLVMVGHMASLRSFGVPYLSPMAPAVWPDMKDAVIRAPWWSMRRRPRQFDPVDSTRARGRSLGRRVLR